MIAQTFMEAPFRIDYRRSQLYWHASSAFPSAAEATSPAKLFLKDPTAREVRRLSLLEPGATFRPCAIENFLRNRLESPPAPRSSNEWNAPIAISATS